MFENDIFWYGKEENEINLKSDKEITINVSGSNTVYIDKMFGPLIFCEVRITPDIKSGKWKIERERITATDEGDKISWEIICEFDCQESIDFDDD